MLSRRNGSLRCIKTHQEFAVCGLANEATLVILAVAYLCAASQGQLWGVKPIDTACSEPFTLQMRHILRNGKGVGSVVLTHDVPRFFRSTRKTAQFNALSLAQGVLV